MFSIKNLFVATLVCFTITLVLIWGGGAAPHLFGWISWEMLFGAAGVGIVLLIVLLTFIDFDVTP